MFVPIQMHRIGNMSNFEKNIKIFSSYVTSILNQFIQFQQFIPHTPKEIFEFTTFKHLRRNFKIIANKSIYYYLLFTLKN